MKRRVSRVWGYISYRGFLIKRANGWCEVFPTRGRSLCSPGNYVSVSLPLPLLLTLPLLPVFTHSQMQSNQIQYNTIQSTPKQNRTGLIYFSPYPSFHPLWFSLPTLRLFSNLLSKALWIIKRLVSQCYTTGLLVSPPLSAASRLCHFLPLIPRVQLLAIRLADRFGIPIVRVWWYNNHRFRLNFHIYFSKKINAR